MMLAALLTLAACAQSDEAARLREELEKARVENFALRLRIARLEKKPDEEARLLREDGLKSALDAIRVLAIRDIAALPADRQKSFADDLVACARTSAPFVRAEAVLSLGRIPAAEPAVLEAASDASPDVRRAAATALRSGTPASLDAVVALTSDAAREVRLAALESAAAVKSDRTLAAVIRVATEDPDPGVVEKAIDILGGLAHPSAVEPIQRVLAGATSDAIRWSAINALGKLGAAQAAPAIRPYLDRARPTNLRDIAAQVLGKLRDRDSVEALTAAFRGDPETRVRTAAARSLGQIGGAAVLKDVLLPASLDERDPAMQKVAWDATLAATGDRFAELQIVVATMLDAGRRAEAEAACGKLHALKLEPAAHEAAARLEERMADASTGAKDWRASLGHLRALRVLQPSRLDVVRRVARCHRELAEHDAAQKALSDALAQAEPQSATWWELKVEQVAAREAAGAHARVIEEAFAAVSNGKPPPEAVVGALDVARRRASAALIADLSSADAAVRKRALEAVKPLGKKIVDALADALTDTSIADRSGILEAGNTITGTTVADLAKAAEIADAWRAWAKK
jgi:HEAT repeat protein